ncbi:branched-chain amino acid ABC transporter permease [Pseudoduganella namucuonensis]|uniref:Branched-chain amino acid transport system permease protein n=1 Tax=Pseudoduganella namucuonensis TaxID=1035707 RepID=A0A1I7LPD5_9BURK|nr:branched-chain amino acid ABC transporter permease [Pseudoduganella namucuonensis]SFV11546.1 branched-chain amino acid transport system permease protein [Pseudoduganella namucuonensis]
MELFLQQTVDGLASGAVYGAFALALVLIHRATHIVNFGQGEMATFTVYVAWQLAEWGLPLWLALAAGAALAFVLGVAVFRAVVRPVSRAPVETVVVVTLGLFLLFDALSLWLWGSDQRAFPSVFPDHGWTVGGVRLTAAMLGVLAVLGALAIVLGALFRYTRFGLAMRASAAEREKSVLVGIRVETMLMFGWGLAAVVGFLAAALVAPRLFLSPVMMAPVLIYALASATLGGWDSPVGAVLGGLLIGVAESVGAAFLSFIGAELRLAIPIAVTLAILFIRPAGLFGKQGVVRV